MLQEDVSMLNHSTLEKSDAEVIVKFPQSEEELFYMFPKAEYPLNPEFLLKEAGNRFSPTVVMLDDKLGHKGRPTGLYI